MSFNTIQLSHTNLLLNAKSIFLILKCSCFLLILSYSSVSQSVNILSYDWKGDLPKSGLVVVNNLYGEIRSRNHSGDQIIVHVNYQQIGHSPLSPHFLIQEKEGTLYVTVIYDEPIKDHNGLRGRSDLSILFPKGIKIAAETDSGMIKIDKTHSPVDAKTKSGNIKVTTTGLFTLQSITGTIHVKLRGMDHFGHSRIFNQKGKIIADIANDMHIALHAETKGSIWINQNKIIHKKHTFHYGKKVNEVSLYAQKGDIFLNKVALPLLLKSVFPTQNVMDIRSLPKIKAWKAGDPIIEATSKTKR
jgi:hypothetical protein